MTIYVRFISGFLFSSLIALLAYRRRVLSPSGILGAILTGTLTLGGGGWSWGLSLIVFFLSSTLLTRWRKRRKEGLETVFAKGGQRDLAQALANGGLGALLALLSTLAPHPLWPAAFAGTLAAATADTWATEVGVLSRTPPRLITTRRVVPPGTSGGITLLGTMAGAAGGLFLGGTFYLLGLVEGALPGHVLLPKGTVLPLGLVGGLSGMLADSLLGATLQGIYRCPRCGRETERKTHCDGPSDLLRGWPWLNNDWVNLAGTSVGALAAVGLGLLFGLY